jgi:hypothetical protein
VDWKRKSVLKSCAISRTRRWNGSLRIKSSVDFWYLLRESYECFPVSPQRRPNLAAREARLKPYLDCRHHVPNLTKRDRTRAVAVRFLHPCDVANEQFPIRQSTRSSTRLRPRHARRRRRSRLREGTGIPSRRASSRRRAPPVVGADLRAALVASCLRGALPPVDFLAVCFVRAIAVDRNASE